MWQDDHLIENNKPTPNEQLKFLKHIQQILQSGTFTSTYKFALLISITRLAIEQGQDTGAALHLDYQDIAEKFIDLYWKQSLPFQFNQYEPFTIHQSTGKQAKIISEIQNAQQQFKTLAALRKDQFHWNQLRKVVAATVKQMPVVYLQNLNGQTVEFLYHLQDSKQSLKLLPKVMYCLRQFSEIIEELCQKRWIDFIRLNKQNLVVLDGLPETGNTEYLRTILSIRSNKDNEAIDHLMRACELDPSKVYRAPLDPEIADLISKYSLQRRIEGLSTPIEDIEVADAN